MVRYVAYMAARLGVLAAIVAFVAIVAPAEATIRKGEGTDPASDTTQWRHQRP